MQLLAVESCRGLDIDFDSYDFDPTRMVSITVIFF
jgi:hypothetical protein